MQTLRLVAGTPEWHAHRAQHFNASDAPAMLGCSPYKTRAQLLRELATGVPADSDAATERRFADGHRFEALARPLAEEIIGDDLAPVVGVLEGTKLSASFDGLTLMGDTAFEHKTVNDSLRYSGWDQGNGLHLPKHFQVQMEQQLLVSGAERVLFMATAWTPSGELIEQRYCWYASSPKLRAEIVAGWEQFAADLAAYVPAAPAAPAAVAAPVESLPAVLVQMTGSLAVHSNLDAFGAALRAFIERIPAQPSTDQEFADCEAACKALKKAEDALEAEDERALNGMADVATVRRVMADLRELARTTRLQREKLVKARKETLRTEQVQRGRTALAAHLQALNQRLGGGFMPDVPADFAGCISGLKSLDSIRDKIDTELARAKIAANEIADRLQVNLKAIDAAGAPGLFPDRGTLALKAVEDCAATIQARLAKEQERQAAERERIRQEEAARLQREQQEKEAAAAREQEEQRRREHNEASRRAMGAISEARAADALPGPLLDTLENVAGDLTAGLAVGRASDTSKAATAAPSVVQMPARAAAPAAPSGPPTLKLGDVNRHLAPMTITADGMRQLGFEGTKDRGAVLYHDTDLPRIIDAAIQRLAMAREQLAKAA